ncbi:MAG: FAD/NAD(P)-binding protein [Nitrospirota bacterium]
MKKNNAGYPKDLYLPLKAKILDVVAMTSDVKLFRLEKPEGFHYSPGQFIMVSVWGAGEVPISIASTPGIHDVMDVCIRKVGHVTSVLHELKHGDHLWIRGPLGNGFPFEDASGRDMLFVAGGIGIAPLRSLVNFVVNRKDKFGKIALIYGSRNPSEVLFMKDVLFWIEKGVEVTLTIDVKCDGWEHCAGLVTEHLDKQKISFKTGYSYICGPHVMISASMRDLSLMGMPAENIITTIEAHMKCGVGKCGHCYIDGKYVCTDGPIFSYAEIKKIGIAGP